MKRNPTVENKFYLVYRLVYISDSMDEFRQLSIRKIVVSSWSKFLLRGLCYQLDSFSDQSYQTLNESLIRMLLYCCLLAEPTSLSNKKTKKFKKRKKNRAFEIVSDQTQLG